MRFSRGSVLVSWQEYMALTQLYAHCSVRKYFKTSEKLLSKQLHPQRQLSLSQDFKYKLKSGRYLLWLTASTDCYNCLIYFSCFLSLFSVLYVHWLPETQDWYWEDYPCKTKLKSTLSCPRLCLTLCNNSNDWKYIYYSKMLSYLSTSSFQRQILYFFLHILDSYS